MINYDSDNDILYIGINEQSDSGSYCADNFEGVDIFVDFETEKITGLQFMDTREIIKAGIKNLSTSVLIEELEKRTIGR